MQMILMTAAVAQAANVVCMGVKNVVPARFIKALNGYQSVTESSHMVPNVGNIRGCPDSFIQVPCVRKRRSLTKLRISPTTIIRAAAVGLRNPTLAVEMPLMIMAILVRTSPMPLLQIGFQCGEMDSISPRL
jgi:hypothetical protein